MNLFLPIHYNEPVFRPPAEANAAIIQATIGCSWNRCAFCEMYTSKKFRVRPFEEIKEDITKLSRYYQGVKKIFLADGNAFVLSANRLLPILDEINSSFGRLQRISAYALPSDIASKTPEELHEIRQAGLKLLYIGIESGDDELLTLINKGETFASMADGIVKAHDAGIETSIMVINGLGGSKYSQQHAINSARLISAVKPKFLSTLTLSLPLEQAHFVSRFGGEYHQQTVIELAEELKLFLENVITENTIFRSDHISNNLILKGILSKDRERLIEEINRVIPLIDSDQYPVTPLVL